MGNLTSSDSAQPVGKKPDKEFENQLQTIRKKMEAGFSMFLLWFSATMFIATIFWVIFAAIVWPTQNDQFERYIIDVEGNRYLEVWSPLVVPGDKEFSEIQFTLHQKNTIPLAVTVGIVMPNQFMIFSTESERMPQTTIIQFSKKIPEETQSIRIANAGITDGLFNNTQKIQVVQFPQNRRLKSFPLAAEGTLRAVLLRYGSNGGNQIPFFPLATLFISVAGFMYQEHERRRQEVEKRSQEQKNTAQASLQSLRKAFEDGQINTAKQLLDELPQDIKKHLKDSDVQIARQLVDLGASDFENIPSTFPLDWLKEVAGVLRFAAENNPINRSKLETILREFPLDKLDDKDIRTALDSIKNVVGSQFPIQDRESNYTDKVSLVKFNPPLKSFSDNPFPFENAEDDLPHLFAESKAMFWRDHPLAGILKSARGTNLVTSEAGSGKTALARALGNYRHVFDQKDVFTCHLRGMPSMNEIQHTLAMRLLDFVERLPSFLILLGDEQRLLLAQTLAFELGRQNVAGRLERASNPVLWTWLNKAGDDEVKRKVWRAETSTHLRMLVDAVRASSPLLFDDRQWVFAFMNCVRSLDFDKNAYLVIDTMERFNSGWYEDAILANQHRWTELNLHTITFRLPGKTRKEKQTIGESKHFELHWDDKQLQDMANWRWGSIYEKKLGSLAVIFLPNAFEMLIKASKNNPRCFIRLWNALVKFTQKMPFNLKDIEQIKEKISCA